MWHVNNVGENNPSYKGDAVGYEAVHIWVRKRKPQPKGCEFCGKDAPLDLANKSGKYSRELNDWNYLCRKCHMDSDGRNDQLRASGKSRKLPNNVCKCCNVSFHPSYREQKYCSMGCRSKGQIGHTVSPATRERIKKALMGHEVSQEVRDKISKSKTKGEGASRLCQEKTVCV